MPTKEEIQEVVDSVIKKNGPVEKGGHFDLCYIEYKEIFMSGVFTIKDLKSIVEIFESALEMKEKENSYVEKSHEPG